MTHLTSYSIAISLLICECLYRWLVSNLCNALQKLLKIHLKIHQSCTMHVLDHGSTVQQYVPKLVPMRLYNNIPQIL